MIGKGKFSFNDVAFGEGEILSIHEEREPDRFSPEDCALNDWIFASSFTTPDNAYSVRVMARPTLNHLRYAPDSGFDHYEPMPIYEFERAKIAIEGTGTVFRAWKRVR